MTLPTIPTLISHQHVFRSELAILPSHQHALATNIFGQPPSYFFKISRFPKKQVDITTVFSTNTVLPSLHFSNHSTATCQNRSQLEFRSRKGKPEDEARVSSEEDEDDDDDDLSKRLSENHDTEYENCHPGNLLFFLIPLSSQILPIATSTIGQEVTSSRRTLTRRKIDGAIREWC